MNCAEKKMWREKKKKCGRSASQVELRGAQGWTCVLCCLFIFGEENMNCYSSISDMCIWSHTRLRIQVLKLSVEKC